MPSNERKVFLPEMSAADIKTLHLKSCGLKHDGYFMLRAVKNVRFHYLSLKHMQVAHMLQIFGSNENTPAAAVWWSDPTLCSVLCGCSSARQGAPGVQGQGEDAAE